MPFFTKGSCLCKRHVLIKAWCCLRKVFFEEGCFLYCHSEIVIVFPVTFEMEHEKSSLYVCEI